MPTTSHSPEDEHAAEQQREVPCLGCVRSLASGKGTGICIETPSARAGRCKLCSKNNHGCEDCPAPLAPLAFRLLSPRPVDNDRTTGALKRCLRTMIFLWDEEDSVLRADGETGREGGTANGPSVPRNAAEHSAALADAFRRVADLTAMGPQFNS